MEWDITYNTAKEPLLISEYGRMVQELLRQNNDIPEGEERQKFINRVIKLMLQMQPQIREQEDFKARLWRHAVRIAGELNVDIPEGIDVTPKAEAEVGDRMSYPNVKMKWKHYGRNVQQLIAKAVEMEEGPKKEYTIKTIAYYMKVAYMSWNRTSKFVTEEAIRTDLYEMSGGKLVLAPNVTLGQPKDGQPAQHDEKKKKRRNRGYNKRKNRNRRR
ncbi:MAG: DUF4290 domain-containing protein [Bacteroidota bacterium]